MLPTNSSVWDHLTFCNHAPSYDDFNILNHETNKGKTRQGKSNINENSNFLPLNIFDAVEFIVY